MGACSSFPVIDWASETCAPVDRGLSVSQSMRHPLEILRSPTSARPFEQLVRGEFGEGSVGTPSASRRSPAAREPASLDRITVLDPHRSYGTTARAGVSEVDARRALRAAVSRRRRSDLPPAQRPLPPEPRSSCALPTADPPQGSTDMVSLSSHRPRETFPPRLAPSPAGADISS